MFKDIVSDFLSSPRSGNLLTQLDECSTLMIQWGREFKSQFIDKIKKIKVDLRIALLSSNAVLHALGNM